MRRLRRHAAPRLEAPRHLRRGVLRVAQRPHARAELAGDLVDSYDPALKEHRTVCFLAFDGHCYRVLERQAARVLYRGEARQILPPIQEEALRTSAPQKPRRQLGAPGVLHDAQGHATLPAKACLTGTTWSSLQVPAVSPQPHSAHLPSCAARVFCLSAAPGTSRFAFSSFKKISCAKPARRWPRLSASHSTSCSSGSSRILVPRLNLSPQCWPGCSWPPWSSRRRP